MEFTSDTCCQLWMCACVVCLCVCVCVNTDYCNHTHGQWCTYVVLQQPYTWSVVCYILLQPYTWSVVYYITATIHMVSGVLYHCNHTHGQWCTYHCNHTHGQWCTISLQPYTFTISLQPYTWSVVYYITATIHMVSGVLYT